MAQRNGAELAAGAAVLVVALGFLGYAVAHTGRSVGAGEQLHASFERIDGLSVGADVRIAGVKVGSVSASRLDPSSFQATVDFNLAGDIHLPQDSSAQISSDGLLGGKYLSLVPGGDTATIPNGGAVTITQSAINIEQLLGNFIFSAANLADNNRKPGGGGQGGNGQGGSGGSGDTPPAKPGDLPPLKP